MALLLDASRKLTRNDIPGAPAWIDPLLSFLNRVVDALFGAVLGNLSLTDNVQCEIATLTLTHGTAQGYTLKKLSSARGMVVLNASGQAIDGWQLSGSSRPGQVKLTVYFKSGAGSASTTVLLFPEGTL